MSDALDEAREACRAALAADDVKGAWVALAPVLEWPAPLLDSKERLQVAVAMFLRVAAAMGAGPLTVALSGVVARPDDPHTLYQGGYALYEAGAHGFAATLLARANKHAPGQPGIVAELASCLEVLGHYGPAALFLDASGLSEGADPMCTYLSGFHWIMSGDLDVPRARVAALEGVTEAPIPFMRDALVGMLARADALVAAGVTLDERALSAWHAVLQGAVLLHESPHGYPDPMRGRYAYISDNAGLMREGLDRLAAVLATRAEPVTRIVAAPDRASHILALAAGKVLSLPVVPWSVGMALDGLFVAWRMEGTDVAFAKALHPQAPGQVLFVHATCWTDPFPYAADVTTLLYQVVTNPFIGGGMKVDPETNSVVAMEPDPRSDEDCAQDIVDAEVSDGSVGALEGVARIAALLRELPPGVRGGLHEVAGQRRHQRKGGPVPSARFT